MRISRLDNSLLHTPPFPGLFHLFHFSSLFRASRQCRVYSILFYLIRNCLTFRLTFRDPHMFIASLIFQPLTIPFVTSLMYLFLLHNSINIFLHFLPLSLSSVIRHTHFHVPCFHVLFLAYASPACSLHSLSLFSNLNHPLQLTLAGVIPKIPQHLPLCLILCIPCCISTSLFFSPFPIPVFFYFLSLIPSLFLILLSFLSISANIYHFSLLIFLLSQMNNST